MGREGEFKEREGEKFGIGKRKQERGNWERREQRRETRRGRGEEET